MRHLSALIGAALPLTLLAAGAAPAPDATGQSLTRADARLQTALRTTAAETSAEVAVSEQIELAGAHGTTTTLTISGNGVVRHRGTTSSAALTLHVSGLGTLEMRELLPKVYLRFPASVRAQLPATTPWIAIDLKALESTRFTSNFAPFGATSDSANGALALLRALAPQGVRTLSQTATVDGIATTEYAATIDVGRAATLGADAAVLRRFTATTHLRRIPVALWVDAENRIRQLTASASVNPPGPSSEHAAIAIRADYLRFGVPVQVSAPPPAETTDVSAVALARTAGS